MVRLPLAQQQHSVGFCSTFRCRRNRPFVADGRDCGRQRSPSGVHRTFSDLRFSPVAKSRGGSRVAPSAGPHQCLWLVALGVAFACLHVRPCQGQSPPAAGPQRESAQTSDGVDLAIWYYPSPAKETLATVMLIHDIGGSHSSVEELALALQATGVSVVAPDLRGHGDSKNRTWPNGKTETIDAKNLRKPDFDAIVASQGGRLREQARLRGDLETVYNWIQKQAATDKKLTPSQLCLAGSGTGGIFVTTWAAADAAWPRIAAGPQGGNVRAVCLISPAYAQKGVNIGPALQTPVVSRELPVIILAGGSERDANRIFEQLKRTRSDAWFEQKPDGSSSKASEVSDPATDASLFLLAYRTTDSADALATAGSKSFAPLLADFFSKQLQP